MPPGLTNEDLNTIRRNALFGSLDRSQVEAVIEHAVISHRGRGETLFLQGEPAMSFFLVLQGWIKVYRVTTAGEEAILGVFTQGQNFAEAAAFVGGIYPASAETVTDVRVLTIPARRIVDKIGETPQIAIGMLVSMSQHLHLLVRQIEQLKAHTGAQRVAEFLVSVAPVPAGSCIIDLPFDKALLAGKLGMKPESLSRAFQRLRAHGVSIDRDQAIVQDISNLINFMEKERGEVMKQSTFER